MIVTCQECQKEYDDALCFTFCPHNQFISEEAAKRKDHAFKVFDSRKKYRVKGTEIIGEVASIDHFGMVSFRGRDLYEVFDPFELEEINENVESA